jgi:hypothetical protein
MIGLIRMMGENIARPAFGKSWKKNLEAIGGK